VVGQNPDVTHLRQQHVKVGQGLFWFSQHQHRVDYLQGHGVYGLRRFKAITMLGFY